MKKLKACLCTCVVIGMTSQVFAQGSLTPPGAPGATMKTLAQVEARIPVSGSTTISQSGSYYLTGSITNGGITISASDVILDLNGYSIVGSGSGNGVTISSASTDVVLRNGVIRSFNSGVLASAAIACRFEQLYVADNTTYGIYLDGSSGACSGNTILLCTLVGNGGNAIQLYAESGGECGYNSIRQCTIGNSGGKGIDVQAENPNDCKGNEISECQIIGNGVSGIWLGAGCNLNRIVDNVVEQGGEGSTGLAVLGVENQVSGNIVRGHDDNYNFAAGNQLDLLISEVPETIAWSASVKLAGSLESTGNGLTISASDVTVDLGGFTLLGDGGTTDMGIYLAGTTNSPIEQVCIKNGIIRNFGTGVEAKNVNYSFFEKLFCGHNTINGIALDGQDGACRGNRIADCSASENGYNGIYLLSYNGICNGNSIVGCNTANNGTEGIYLAGSYGQCDGNRIEECNCSGNKSHGIILYGSNGTADGNLIINCLLEGNTDYALQVEDGDENRIDGNQVSGTTGAATRGIYTVNCRDNLIIRNSSTGHAFNYFIDVDDTVGPLITAAGIISNANPWANFSF